MGIASPEGGDRYPSGYPFCSRLVPNSPVSHWTIIAQNLA